MVTYLPECMGFVASVGFPEIFLSLAVTSRIPFWQLAQVELPGHRTWQGALLVALATTAAAKYATLNL